MLLQRAAPSTGAHSTRKAFLLKGRIDGRQATNSGGKALLTSGFGMGMNGNLFFEF
jgi:hypothetical protein